MTHVANFDHLATCFKTREHALSMKYFYLLLSLFCLPGLTSATDSSKIFISVDHGETNSAPAWEIAKEIGMRLPVGGTLTTKAYQEIYTSHFEQSIVLTLNSQQRPGPYVIKSKNVANAELQITEIFPSNNVDDLVLAFLEAKRKFQKVASNKKKITMLVLHTGKNEGCEENDGKIDCAFEGQFHQFMRKLPPGQIDIIVRTGANAIVGNLKNSMYIEVPHSGHVAYDLTINSEMNVDAKAISLCKYVSQHSHHCRGDKLQQTAIGPAMFLGRSVQRQINTLLSSQTSLSPGLQKPDAESL
jgi:hypothetical protein